MMEVIRDKYGRTFKTLRVSLLSHCNLACVYCVAGEEELREMNGASNEMGVEGLLGVIRRLHEELRLETIRLTGGEPLLYPGLVQLVEGLVSIGLTEIKLTTNGTLLERKAVALKRAGLQSINVSLDAVEDEVFARMSRRNSVGQVIRGIEAALAAGLTVKLNAVIMKGMNDDQVLPLLDFAFERGITVRFLEVMGMHHLYHHSDRYLMTQQEILRVVGQRHLLTDLGRDPSATARYWITEQGQRFGIIANESEPFCRDCDRLRLDSSGQIYGCLSSNQPITLDMRESPEEWRSRLRQALDQKQPLRFTGSALSMLQIGG